MHRQSPRAAGSGRLAEAAALHDLQQHVFHPRWIVRTLIVRFLWYVRRLAENLQPHVDRAALGACGKLVDRRLDRDRIDDMRRRTPGAGRDTGEWRAISEACIWNPRWLQIGVQLLEVLYAANVAAVGFSRMLAAWIFAIRVS